MQGLHKLLLLYVLTCLGQNGHGITGWKIVPEDMMQYMVSLQDGHGKHLCAGFLVSKNFLITSASCDKPDLIVVYYGVHNLEERRKYRYIDIRCTDSDIMLLKLSKNVIGDNVKTTEIPNSEIDLKVNQQCVVAGWGPENCEICDDIMLLKLLETEIDLKVNQHCVVAGRGPENCEKASVKQLRMVNVSVINCTEKVTDLPANVICTREKGFCELDAGGPLVCDGKAVGVVVYDKKKNSATFANISAKHVWIEDKMNDPNGEDCSSMLVVLWCVTLGVVFSKNKKLFPSFCTDISTKHKWITDKRKNPKEKDCR